MTQSTTLSPRGSIGVLPRPSRLADESYTDFVESFRDMALVRMFPQMCGVGHQVLEEAGIAPTHEVPLKTVQQHFNAVPLVQSWQRFMRTAQEMMWRRTRQSFAFDEAGHEALLKEWESKGPGTLSYDSAFHVPDWARREIHLQPGGYTDDALSGIVYHYGTKIFYQGWNDQDALHAEVVDLTATPDNGIVDNLLEIGCGVGQATVQFRRRFPEAKIIGLDVGLPLLRYAHMRSAQLGADVDYVQALAEAMPFADGSQDVVMSYIFFHEMPVEVMKGVLKDVYRVLRPGGKFSIFEFPSHGDTPLPPAVRFMIDYDSRDNCEPYSVGFVYSDFRGLIAEAGFTVSDGGKPMNDFLQSVVATKPL
jgi:ubiquinone/menaquinone biosynthesis C-methylase UbiE